MTSLEDLSCRIDEVLLIQSFEDSGARSADVLARLFALADDCAAQPSSQEARAAVSDLLAMGTGGPAGEEEKFRATLLNLRGALERQKENEAAASQLADDPELVSEFIVEARDHLASVEAGVLRIERNPGDVEAVNAVFRSFHTIKGLAGFLGATAIQELAHETESLLDLARSGKLRVSPDVSDVILRSADALTKCLNIAESGKLSDIPRCGADLFRDIATLNQTPWTPETLQPPDRKAGAELPAFPSETPAETPAPAGASSAGAVLRVSASKLEYLIDMVGELVIAESVVRNDSALARSDDPALSRNLKQLARVVQEVQKTSMSMRMVAVGSLFTRMSRLVRDLSRKSGKLVDLVTVGDNVELDRGIVEDLADPLVHMIRNAVDHGLEVPEDRVRAGKPERGTVRLKAMHDAGDIVIEVGDDGRGLDSARILARARRMGLVDEHEQPDEESLFKMIFEAGFSTAEKVTDLSGRGVGMDVVRKQIQKLRGRISIRSRAGQGSTFVLRLPLTLAIIDGLVVSVGAQRYILPMFAVREMFSPGPGTFVTLENRAEAAMFRDRLLPVIRLSRLLEPSADARNGGVLVVVEGRDQLYCIAVDQLIGKQEVVIKSLGKTCRDVPAISGGAILGDGRVGLIIDVNTLRYQN